MINSPSYCWQEVEITTNTVSLKYVQCPVAEYFNQKVYLIFCSSMGKQLIFRWRKYWITGWKDPEVLQQAQKSMISGAPAKLKNQLR